MRLTRGRWKRPKKDEMQPGAKARVQHVTHLHGPKPRIIWIEGKLALQGKSQIVFVSENLKMEFPINVTTEVEIYVDG